MKDWLQGLYKANRTGLATRYKRWKARPLAGAFRARMDFSVQEYADYRREKLLAMLGYAVEHVPHYAEHRSTYAPEQFRETRSVAEVLRRLPLLDKQMVRSESERFYSREGGLSYRAFQTGGTTGSPLVLHATKETFAYIQASLGRLFLWAGVGPSDRIASLTGFFRPGLGQQDRLCWRDYVGGHLFLSMYHLTGKYAGHYKEMLERFRPKAYFGYASAVYLLARMFRLADVAPPSSAVAAFTTAEVLYPSWRSEIESALGVKVYDQYGSQEASAIAYDCGEGQRHITPEQGIIEVVGQTGEPCAWEVEGEIVLTGLVNRAMPLIRYRLGDRGSLADPEFKCSCGLCWPVLKTVVGRSEDVIWTPAGRPVTQLSIAIRHTAGLEQCQFIQDRHGHMRVLLVVSSEYRPESEADIKNEILGRSGYPYEVDFEYVERIPWTGRGKYKVVVDMVGQQEGGQGQ